MFTAETRRLGLLEIKAKDDPRVNSVAAVAIWVGIIPVIRGSPVIRPIVVLPVITLVVSPTTMLPFAGFGLDRENCEADREGTKENEEFVHKGSCVQLRRDSCSSEQRASLSSVISSNIKNRSIY
jgi:hypothetical protein